MVDVTIDELLDGESIRNSAAAFPFNLNEKTFRGSGTPAPVDLIPISNEAQLEDALGVNPEIPDNESRTIVYLNDFTHTKPVLMGIDSSLEIYMATNKLNVNYTGPGSFVQMKTPGTSGRNLTFPGVMRITGDGTNSLFDVKLAEGVSFNIFVAENFKDFGTIEAPQMNFNLLGLIGLTTGMVLKNATNITGRAITVLQTGATGITTMSIIGTTPTVATIEQLNGTLFAGDALLFLDPNTTGRSIITNSTRTNGDFYQQGVDIPATANAVSGSNTQFDITAHNLVVGQYTVLKDFTTQRGYNGTVKVVAINDVNSVDLEIAFLGADSTGTMNAASLDNISPPVNSFGNEGSDNSMASAQVGFTNISTPIVVSIVTQDTPVIIGGTQFVSSNLERVTTTTGGQITNLNPKTRKYPITFSGLIEKVGGGSTDIGILLIKNGSLVLTETFEIPHSVNAGVIQISATRTFELEENDTLDIAVVNFNGSADISVSQINMSYSVDA